MQSAGTRTFARFALVALAVAWTLSGRPSVAFEAPALSLSPAAEDAIDRETPRRTLDGFLKESRDGHFRTAAAYLDLRALPANERDERGPDLARKLGYVLERDATLSLAKVPDDPAGAPGAKSPDTYVADTLYAGEEPAAIALQRVKFADGFDRWLISEHTVQLIPIIDAAYGPRPIGVRIPAALTRFTFLGNELWQWIGVVLALLVAFAVARLTAWLVVRVGTYFARRSPTKVDDVLVASSRRPLRTIIGGISYRLLLEILQLSTAVLSTLEHLTYTVLVIGAGWFLLNGLGVLTLLLDERAGRDGFGALRGRQVRTQAVLLQRVASVVIVFVCVAIVLLQFDFVRNVGVSLLASAGVLGVALGFAAQQSLAAIIGGIQFSFAQPVRMGDEVVVEGQFGDIEEINLTYAVIRLWDKRRLIVPITYFLTKPFENWTRSTTDLVGAVVIKAPADTRVDDVRAELERVCKADPLWDKGTCSLQVTDADGSTVTLRALVSAGDAKRLWDLRCNVRERLVTFAHPAPPKAPAAATPAPPPDAPPAPAPRA
jgi:small-conductance mechanosensitive channel